MTEVVRRYSRRRFTAESNRHLSLCILHKRVGVMFDKTHTLQYKRDYSIIHMYILFS